MGLHPEIYVVLDAQTLRDESIVLHYFDKVAPSISSRLPQFARFGMTIGVVYLTIVLAGVKCLPDDNPKDYTKIHFPSGLRARFLKIVLFSTLSILIIIIPTLLTDFVNSSMHSYLPYHFLKTLSFHPGGSTLHVSFSYKPSSSAISLCIQLNSYETYRYLPLSSINHFPFIHFAFLKTSSTRQYSIAPPVHRRNFSITILSASTGIILSSFRST